LRSIGFWRERAEQRGDEEDRKSGGKNRRRPNRSASEPAACTSAASDSAYASMPHWRSAKLAPRSSRIDGGAT